MKPHTALRWSVAMIATASLVAAPFSAHAASDESSVSFAEGRFLTGTVAGIDLDTLVQLAPARAVNDGSSPQSEVRNPLNATALKSLTVASEPLSISGLNGVTLGAVGQYARAAKDGSSFASSGAIGDNGAISANPGGGGSAVVELTPLLGGTLTKDIADLSLSVDMIAAQAEAALADYSGDYALAGLKLNFEVPSIAKLPGQAAAVLGPIQGTLNGLAGSSGSIAKAVDAVLRQKNAALGILGNTATVDVTVDARLAGIVETFASAVLRDAALTIDLGSGVVTVDLAKLPSTKNLNGLAPGTELLSKAVVGDIVSGLTRLLSNHVKGLESALRTALGKAGITVTARLSLLDQVKTGDRTVEHVTTVTQVVDRLTGKVLGILDPSTGTVTSLVPGLSGSELEKSLNGLLDGLLAKLLGLGNGVTTKVVQEVTQVLEPILSALETKVDLSLKGTADQFRSGTGVSTTADLTVLGADVGLDAGLLLSPIAGLLNSTVLGSGSTAARAIDGLSTGVLDPVLTAIDGNQPSALNSILGEVVSVKANVQETSSTPDGDSYFTQTALRVSVLGDAATLSLANATVGPNALNDGGTPGGDDPGDDDGSSTVPAADDGGFLAHTGGFLAVMAILAALALLVVGAYLVIRNRMRGGDSESDAAQELIV